MYHYLNAKVQNDWVRIVDIEPWIENNPEYEKDPVKAEQRNYPKKVFNFNGGIVDDNFGKIITFYEGLPEELKPEFKKDFTKIGKIHGWFYETFLPSVNNEATEENLDKAHTAIRAILMILAKKYNLGYGTD